ncbi:MAG: hypothetical protein ACI8ZM_001327 [Crocinitomix sp.]
MFITFYIILAITAGYGFLFFRSLSNPIKLLTIWVLLVLISELSNKYLVSAIGTNFPVMQVFIIVGVLFNGLIYYHLLKQNKRYLNIILLSTGIAFLLSILNLIFLESLYDFPSNGLIITAFQIVIFVFLTYVSLLFDSRKIAIYKQSTFWLNSGNFVFWGVTFFIFAFFKFIYKIEDNRWVYDLLRYANFAMYIFFFIAIFLNSKETDE